MSVHDWLFTFDPTDERDADPQAVNEGVLISDLFMEYLTAMEMTVLKDTYYRIDRSDMSIQEKDVRLRDLVDSYEAEAKRRRDGQSRMPGKRNRLINPGSAVIDHGI